MIAELNRVWDSNSYVEPFLGGGAVLLAGAPWGNALAADINEDLIRTFIAVQAAPADVCSHLGELTESKVTYEAERRGLAAQPDESRRAAAFIFLNRCAYGGIYRTNLRGEFNVPFGGARGLSSLQAVGALDGISEALQGIVLRVASYAETLDRVSGRALVYCDPAYVSPRDGVFDRYQSGRFTWQDQIALAKQARSLADAGHLVAVSNGFDPEIRALYGFADEVFVVRRRAQLPKSTTKQVKEYLFLLGSDASDVAADVRACAEVLRLV